MSKYNIWFNSPFVKLQIHEFDDLAVIVPANYNESLSFSFNEYLGPKFFAISITLSIIIICRKFFRCVTNSPKSDIAGSFIDTIGAYLGTKATCKMYNRPERILVMILFIFSQTTLLWFSGSLIQSFITKKLHRNINTLDELAESKLTILVTLDVSFGMKSWIPFIE